MHATDRAKARPPVRGAARARVQIDPRESIAAPQRDLTGIDAGIARLHAEVARCARAVDSGECERTVVAMAEHRDRLRAGAAHETDRARRRRPDDVVAATDALLAPPPHRAFVLDEHAADDPAVRPRGDATRRASRSRRSARTR